MAEARIEAPAPHGTLDGRLFRPDRPGPWPLVVFFMDAFGLRPALARMAERLAAEGYAVLQPNLYARLGPLELPAPAAAFSDAATLRTLMQWVESVQPARALADTQVLIERVTGDDGRIRAERIGTIGYCMGGRIAFISAEQLADRVAAAACIHPGGLVTDDDGSPHRGVAAIRGTVYVAAADEDPALTPEQQNELRAALEAARVVHSMEFYEGKRHGFAVPDLPVYDEAAAERHWQRLLSLFDSVLRE